MFEKRTVKDTAYRYQKQGHAVVAFKVTEKGKKPLVEWKRWITDNQTEEEFKNQPWDVANAFGIVCGRKLKNNGLFIGAIDYDVKNVTDEAKKLGKKALTKIRTTQTEQTVHGGLHYIYYSKAPIHTHSIYHNTHSLELLGEKRLIILAPSTGYKLLNDNRPTVLEDLEGYFFELLDKKKPVYAKVMFDRKDHENKAFSGKDPACIKSMLRGVDKGIRNETAVRLASYYANFRKQSPEATWRSLRKWNSRNSPQIGQDELNRVCKSAIEHCYNYGCGDEVFEKHCVGRSECRLGVASLSISELVQEELERLGQVKVHPLIDYSAKVGYTIGTHLQPSCQTLLISAGKVFVGQDWRIQEESPFPISISLEKVRWAGLAADWKKEILILIDEIARTGRFEFKPENEVFSEVSAGVKHYFYIPDEQVYTLIACWIIGTVFHVLFSYYPILNPQGQRETGKTTLLDLLCKMAWNPTVKTASLKEAGIYRTIQDGRRTFIADISKLNPRSQQYSDIKDILENGTEIGGGVIRVNKDTGEPVEYKIYSPKAVATRYELPFVVKCIRIITEEPSNKREYSKKRAGLDRDQRWGGVIRILLRSAVKSWESVLKAYGEVEQTDRLTGRPFNYWQPLLAVCKVYASEKYDDLLSLAEKMAEEQERGDRLSEVENAVITVFMDYEIKSTTITLRDLTHQVQDLIPWVKSWHIVRSAIQNIGIIRRQYATRKGVTYQIDVERIKTLAEKKGILSTELPVTMEKNTIQTMEKYVENVFVHSEEKTLPCSSSLTSVTSVTAEDPDFLWRQIQPSEKCELCGAFAVEYEVNDLHGKQILRRCNSCFEKMRRSRVKSVWREVE